MGLVAQTVIKQDKLTINGTNSMRLSGLTTTVNTGLYRTIVTQSYCMYVHTLVFQKNFETNTTYKTIMSNKISVLAVIL